MLGLTKVNVSQAGRGPQVQQPPASNRYFEKTEMLKSALKYKSDI